MRCTLLRRIFPLSLLALAHVPIAFAAESAGDPGTHNIASTFLWIAFLLVAAKMASLVERFGQPAVLGELIMGVLLGNLVLVGIPWIEPVKHHEIIRFLAELGVVILLFQIGLESNIQKMRKVGVRALLVATVGVIAPFVLGTYIVGPLLLPGLQSNAYLFLGAALTATSVGITARVFRDLKKLQSPEAQIVLGAAVIDDVIGLIILAVVSAIATEGTVNFAGISLITLKALAFLVGSIVIGHVLAPRLGKLFSMIHTGVGMKFTLAVCFGLVIAGLAQQIGLAPIVGAFAAGLVLEPVHFRYFKDPKVVSDVKASVEKADSATRQRVLAAIEPHADRHIDDIIEPLGHFLVPIFFIMIGMGVKLETLGNLPVLLVALGITAVAFVGKIVSGLAAGPVRKSLVGWGMVPRGEVGLIFASMGLSLGVLTDKLFSVIIIMVILTTLLTPPILTFLLRRSELHGSRH
ncbi:cation:proton antiporter [Candidatus Peregrinibacteria bacterium]|nr:cation:proton antiporter [Candidatus Peregrinibacteria bacterium]